MVNFEHIYKHLLMNIKLLSMKVYFANSDKTLDLDPKKIKLLKNHMEISSNQPFIVDTFEYDSSFNNIHMLTMMDENTILNCYNFYDYLMADYNIMQIIVLAIQLCVKVNVDHIIENYPEIFKGLNYVAQNNFERFMILCENDLVNIKKYIISSLSLGKLDVIKKYWGDDPEQIDEIDQIDQNDIEAVIESGNINAIKYVLNIPKSKNIIDGHLEDYYMKIIKHNDLDMFNMFHEVMVIMFGHQFINLYGISYKCESSNLFKIAIDIMTNNCNIKVYIEYMNINTTSENVLFFHLNYCITQDYEITAISLNTFYHCTDIIFSLIHLEKIKMWLTGCMLDWYEDLCDKTSFSEKSKFNLNNVYGLLCRLIFECEEYIHQILYKESATSVKNSCFFRRYPSLVNYNAMMLIINWVVTFAINIRDYEFLYKFKIMKIARFVDENLPIDKTLFSDNNYECLYDKLIINETLIKE